MRRFPYFALLAASAASAHVVNFAFTAPEGVGNRVADGGFAVLQWTDGPDTPDVARVSLYAVAGGVSPLVTVDPQTLIAITPGELRINDPTNVYAWDTSGLTTGCYQPVAILNDPLEGVVRAIAAPGVFSVGQANELPPSIWITSSADTTADENGNLALRAVIDIPFGEATIAFNFVQPGHETPVENVLVVNGSVHEVTFVLNTRQAPAGLSFVRARIATTAGRFAQCDAYWQGLVQVGSLDGGELLFDGGFGDGGVLGPRLGLDASGPPVWGGGGACGCGSATSGTITGLLAWLLRRRHATGQRSPPAAVCL
ncbi:MAG: hypothetical protein K1X64_05355 [Myxococcaceae bacterium]|nr:hypothetical protein [Myxococcaceae bacterium]